MNWKLCVSDPQGRALILCRGSMDEGDGFGYGSGYGYSYGDGFGNGNCKGYGDGGSPPEWK